MKVDCDRVLGYDAEKAWGHITTDGTIANYESLWLARNLKSFPLAVKEERLPRHARIRFHHHRSAQDGIHSLRGRRHRAERPAPSYCKRFCKSPDTKRGKDGTQAGRRPEPARRRALRRRARNETAAG